MSRFYRLHEVEMITTLSRSTIVRREKDTPDFFKRCKISPRRIIYNADEVDRWMERQLLNP